MFFGFGSWLQPAFETGRKTLGPLLARASLALNPSRDWPIPPPPPRWGGTLCHDLHCRWTKRIGCRYHRPGWPSHLAIPWSNYRKFWWSVKHENWWWTFSNPVTLHMIFCVSGIPVCLRIQKRLPWKTRQGWDSYLGYEGKLSKSKDEVCRKWRRMIQTTKRFDMYFASLICPLIIHPIFAVSRHQNGVTACNCHFLFMCFVSMVWRTETSFVLFVWVSYVWIYETNRSSRFALGCSRAARSAWKLPASFCGIAVGSWSHSENKAGSWKTNGVLTCFHCCHVCLLLVS